jgi:hypothetical protein
MNLFTSICYLFTDAVSNSGCTSSNDYVVINWKERGSVYFRTCMKKYYLVINNPQKTQLRKVGVQAQIPNGRHSNTS